LNSYAALAALHRNPLGPLSPLEATHIKRVRSVFEDPDIVAVGIAEKVTEK
jgi:hypothetical protein